MRRMVVDRFASCITLQFAIGMALLFAAPIGCRGDSVDDYISSEMSRQHVPGLAVAIIKDGKPIKVKGYGWANSEHKVPVTIDTLFDVGSMSKPVTAAAILLLVEGGKIQLEDKLTRFLSDVPAGWRKITIRHLLTHTSGIKDYLSELPSTAALEFTPDLIYHRALSAPLNFPPGTQFKYSHTNYVLLGMVIQSTTGRPFHDYVSEHIFKPLAMDHTRPQTSDQFPSDLAQGFRLQNGEIAPVEREKRPFADAFFASSASDIAAWAEALDNGTLLSKEARDLMWTAQPLLPKSGVVKSAPYGLGWYVESVKGHTSIGHGGSVGGFSANLTRFPDDHLSVAVLANQRDMSVFPIIRGIAAKYVPDLK